MNKERKNIRVELEPVYLDGEKASELIKVLEEAIDRHGPTVTVEKIDYRYEDGHYWCLMAERPETDDEMNKRIHREAEMQAELNAYERRQYEALKAKYGNGS